MFGSYYVVYKDLMHRREVEQSSLLIQLAQKRNYNQSVVESSSENEDSESDSDEFTGSS